jgi:alcohol dehydrogenase class IV
VLDAGKAVAMLMANGGDPLDYAEVIGKGNPVRLPSLPCVAVPTTAGAGSEATRNAVLRSREHGVKVSLRSNRMMPAVALVDPELAYGLPPAVTAATGLDALSQVMEPFVSCRANAFTDMLCREGLVRIARSLPAAFADGRDLAARTDMALGALYGGMALANAGLGAVHGFAAPLGGMFDAPHGAVCAALLAPVMEANVRAGGAPVRERYAEVARLVCGAADATAGDGVRWVRALTGALGIPGLRAYGVGEEHVEVLCERAAAASSMRGNPVVLDRETLRGVLRAAL